MTASLGNSHDVILNRYVYTSGKDVSNDVKSLRKQLDKGLVLNVNENGEWGSVRNVEFKNNVTVSNIEMFLANSNR